MTAWEIYWVMQLDSIKSLFAWLGWMGAFVAGAAALCHLTTDFEYPALARLAKWAAVASLVAATLTTFIPSTKTAAAMVVIPAIANNETIRAEAADLYSLAKDALRKAVDAPEESKE